MISHDPTPTTFMCCSAYDSSMEALQQPTIRVVAVIAEGVPEADTKRLIAYARAHNKVLLGPATVGGIQVCASSAADVMCASRASCGGGVPRPGSQRACQMQGVPDADTSWPAPGHTAGSCCRGWPVCSMPHEMAISYKNGATPGAMRYNALQEDWLGGLLQSWPDQMQALNPAPAVCRLAPSG